MAWILPYQLKPQSFRSPCKLDLLSQHRKQHLLNMSTTQTKLFQASARVFKGQSRCCSRAAN